MEKLEIKTKSSKNTETKPKNTQKPNQRKGAWKDWEIRPKKTETCTKKDQTILRSTLKSPDHFETTQEWSGTANVQL